MCRVKNFMSSTPSDYKGVQMALEHYCKMRQFAAPEFLRRLVASGVQGNMPSGLIVHKVAFKPGTLAAVATGSDMVRITLPDLASKLLGTGVALAIREGIKDLFSKAELFGAGQIEEELTKYIEELPIAGFHDVGKQAVMRLKDRLFGFFDGNLPECPITMEPIAKEDIRILGCCTAVLDGNSLPGCRGRCPLCRAPLTTTFAVKKEEQEEKDGDLTGKKRKSAEEGEGEEDATINFDDEINKISESRPYSVDGVLEVLKVQCTMKPDSRVLLCFGFERSQRYLVDKVIDRIKVEIEGAIVTDIDTCAHRDYVRMDSAMLKFNDLVRYPTPNVFILNTTESTKSVQGLDLHAADLTIVDGHCSLAVQRQAVGRSLRMKKRPETMKPGEKFPPKRVVVTSVGF